ncbi:hypothetical protein [uncultured Maricaulis sp.]|uniref:hypothetical protein n=1 Tax=uncultured Maricaulis sp. TaxID=174710 RepID=UPI0030D709F7|tara:strand:- start:44566 stop:45168 length:603 start_codon:yes stop_codon:yes gene_type:complete
MRLIEHFSVYQKLPIKIDDIASFLIEAGYVEGVEFHPTAEDGTVLAGMLYHVRYKPPYVSGDGYSTAHIVYHTGLPEPVQRMICAKELLHIADSDEMVVRIQEDVNRLTTEMVIPPAAISDMNSLGIKTISDHAGMLRAAALLFPIEARDSLKPFYDKAMSAAEIAGIVDLPFAWVDFIMSDAWPGIYEQLISTGTKFCK